MKNRIIVSVIIALILGLLTIINMPVSEKEYVDAVDWSDTLPTTTTSTTTEMVQTQKILLKKKKKKKAKKKTAKAVHTKNECMQFAYNELVNRYGWDDEIDWSALVSLWNRESGWNALSVNKKTGACGIAQAYPCSKMKKYGSDYKTNCYTQINWGLAYVSARYGTPKKAWKHFKKYGWY